MNENVKYSERLILPSPPPFYDAKNNPPCQSLGSGLKPLQKKIRILPAREKNGFEFALKKVGSGQNPRSWPDPDPRLCSLYPWYLY